MRNILVPLLIFTCFPYTHSLFCSSCTSECPRTDTCKGGVIYDRCGCCKVCAKTEWEPCGIDITGTEWICDSGLVCMLRNFPVSRCEQISCRRKRCGLRQLCELTRHGKPVCVCPRNCRTGQWRQTAVCGKNGKQYTNACELYRHECLLGEEIGIMWQGPCKKCYYNGKTYKYGNSRKGDLPCEKCTCHHGQWRCRTRRHCVDHLRTCTVFQNRSGAIVSTCPSGYWCKVQIPGIPEQGIPEVGVCVAAKTKLKTLRTINSTSPTTGGPRTKTKPSPSSICRQPMAEGDCRAAIQRWYYNINTRKCTKFTYGGCGGNANNFPTKSKCRNTCMRKSPPLARPTKPIHKRVKTTKAPNWFVVCKMPPATGPCRAAMPQWYYNTKRRRCVRFIYGGCGGNDNNFDTKEKCKAACMRKIGTRPTPPPPTDRLTSANAGNHVPIESTARPTADSTFTGMHSTTERKTELSSMSSSTEGRTNTTELAVKTTKSSIPTSQQTTSRQTTSRQTTSRQTTSRQTTSQQTTSRQTTSRQTTSRQTTSRQTTSRQTESPSWESHVILFTFRPPPKSTRPSPKFTRSPRKLQTYKCLCTECSLSGKAKTCDKAFGCYTEHAEQKDDGKAERFGCIENKKIYRMMCHAKPLGNLFPKVTVKCCKGNLCNAATNDVLQKDRGIEVKTTQATVVKETITRQGTMAPRCYDAHNKKFYGERDEWKPNDCTVCTCVDGHPECVATVCRHPNCEDAIRIKGQCCPVCPLVDMIKALAESHLSTVQVTIKKDRRVCEDINSGELYLVGQSWKVDDCTTCYCQKNGKVECALQMCGYPICPNPVKEKGHCCPVCRDEAEEELRSSENEVIESPHSCPDPVTGDYYRRHEMWQQDECTACACGTDRKLHCTKRTCARPQCENPIHGKGRCCPVCPDQLAKGCIFEGRKYVSGAFKLLADDCTLCECVNSEWKCSTSRCRDPRPGE